MLALAPARADLDPIERSAGKAQRIVDLRDAG